MKIEYTTKKDLIKQIRSEKNKEVRQELKKRDFQMMKDIRVEIFG